MEKQFVAFKVANSFYCIDIMDVREVIRENNITNMPNFPSFVEGVVNLRGSIVPILAIHRRLGDQSFFTNPINSLDKEFDAHFSTNELPTIVSPPMSSESIKQLKNGQSFKLIVINVNTIKVGLLVDSLDKILSADESEIQNAEGLGRSVNHKMVSGLLHINNDIYIVLNANSILESEETKILSQTIQQI